MIRVPGKQLEGKAANTGTVTAIATTTVTGLWPDRPTVTTDGQRQ
jgi:hypothetical protein